MSIFHTIKKPLKALSSKNLHSLHHTTSSSSFVEFWTDFAQTKESYLEANLPCAFYNFPRGERMEEEEEDMWYWILD